MLYVYGVCLIGWTATGLSVDGEITVEICYDLKLESEIGDVLIGLIEKVESGFWTSYGEPIIGEMLIGKNYWLLVTVGWLNWDEGDDWDTWV